MTLRADRPCLHKIVHGLLADREEVGIGLYDVVDGLAFPGTAIHHVADLMELFFRHVDPLAGFFEYAEVTFLRNPGHVIPLRQRALPLTAATVADIWRSDKPRTFLGGEHAAQFIA